MTLSNLDIGAFALGLAGIAAALYLLQRLRVRHRDVEVVTTMFWKQAVEETRARVLMRRFRHPLAYLLALAIGALIWTAFAAPRREADKNTEFVVLLDASAGMDWGERFAVAKRTLQRETERLPIDRRRVYACAVDARLVLDRGEEGFLLGPRLEALEPEACPGSIERELIALASRAVAGTADVRVLVVGDAPVSESVLQALPERLSVQRLRPPETPVLERNSGVAAIGVAEATSGAFDRVDVMLRLDAAGAEPPRVAATLGGLTLERAPTLEGDAYTWRDLPANGAVLEVSLTTDDALRVDDVARVTLPARRALGVAFGPTVDERFRYVVAADPALDEAPTTAEARVAVGASGSLPSIEIVDGSSVTIVHEQDASPADRVRSRARFARLGLDRVGRRIGENVSADAGELSLRFVDGERRGVRVGAELLGDDWDFAQTSAFPVFVSEAIRWLADATPVNPFARAGERLVPADQLSVAGADVAPPRAGDCETNDGSRLAVSLAAVSLPASDALDSVARSSDGGDWPSPMKWCVLIALVLIAFEWWLCRRGRIP